MMRALILNATLRKPPSESDTGALARYVGDEPAEHAVELDHLRLVDHRIEPGVVREAVEWPALHDEVLEADILVTATPTGLGQPSSVSKRALEGMDAMLSETQEDGTPVACDRVIMTGNEHGAHHLIAEVSQPGEEEYLTSDDTDWSNSTGVTAAQNLLAVAEALQAHPMPPPPGG